MSEVSEATGEVGCADEEGYCQVVVRYEGETNYHYIRHDQAHQWLAQELECLNDPRVYGIDLPESELMDSEERAYHELQRWC